MAVGTILGLVAIRELLDAIQDPYGNTLATDRAEVIVARGLLRIPGDLAFAMTIMVILSLLRKELHGAEKAVRISRPNGRGQGLIGQFGIEKVCLTSQLLRRVGIGVGNDGEAIEKTAAPVHRWITR